MEYQWNECVKNGLFGCRSWEVKTELYDLRDPATRTKLADMGFVVEVEKTQP